MINPVGWYEIYVDDINRAKSFYESLFSIQLTRLDNTELEMWAFPMSMSHYGSSGALVKMPGFKAGGNSVLVYFSSADCTTELEKVQALGGHIQKTKTSIGPYGHIALLLDTEGNMLGLHSQR